MTREKNNIGSMMYYLIDALALCASRMSNTLTQVGRLRRETKQADAQYDK
jgi:hypothetical protein